MSVYFVLVMGVCPRSHICFFSSLLSYLECTPFNTAENMFTSFVTGVHNYSISSSVRLERELKKIHTIL